MTVLSEMHLTERERDLLSRALLLHDVLEDTNSPLPEGTDHDVRVLVDEMTFPSFAEEAAAFERMSDLCRLGKLYDKVSNLMDGGWMSKEKREQYETHIVRLARYVEGVYGPLNIVKIAYALLQRDAA